MTGGGEGRSAHYSVLRLSTQEIDPCGELSIRTSNQDASVVRCEREICAPFLAGPRERGAVCRTHNRRGWRGFLSLRDPTRGVPRRVDVCLGEKYAPKSCGPSGRFMHASGNLVTRCEHQPEAPARANCHARPRSRFGFVSQHEYSRLVRSLRADDRYGVSYGVRSARTWRSAVPPHPRPLSRGERGEGRKERGEGIRVLRENRCSRSFRRVS